MLLLYDDIAAILNADAEIELSKLIFMSKGGWFPWEIPYTHMINA